MAGQGERAPRRQLSREKKEQFLAILGETGNRRIAAEAIGVEPRLMDQRRRFDPWLDRQWGEALARAERRLAGASGPLDTGRAFNVIRKGAGGRTQIVAAGPKRWSRKSEDTFLAALGMCGNVAAAARAAGFSESCIWQRRRKYPAFAAAMEAVLEEAEIRIEFRMAAMGSELAAAGLERWDAGEDGSTTGPDAPGGAVSGPCPPEPFDPDLAFRFLKWREGKRLGRQPARGRATPRRMTFEEAIGALDKKLKAFGARHERERLAQGWVKDENGYMIPPGWVRAAPPQ